MPATLKMLMRYVSVCYHTINMKYVHNKKFNNYLTQNYNCIHFFQIEMIDKVEKEKQNQMIINTEWGAFGDKGEIDFLRTKWDKSVDNASLNPGRQVFEKLISGMYMGETVRQILLDLVEKKLVLESQQCLDKLQVPGSFESKYVSMVESDPIGSFDKCRAVMDELGMPNVSNDDCATLRYVCAVSYTHLTLPTICSV